MADTEVQPIPPPGAVNGKHAPAVKAVPTVSLTKPAAAPDTTPDPAGATPARPGRVRRSVRVAYGLVTDERTRAACRLMVRHGMYVAGGSRILTRRAWDGRTAARYERLMRAAEAAGNMELAQHWEERGQTFRAARHKRRIELMTMPQQFAKGLAWGIGAACGGLLILGAAVALATGKPGDTLIPFHVVIETIRIAVLVGTTVWGPLMMAGPWLLLAALWSVGRKQQAAPQWALPARDRDSTGAAITPSIVVTALRDLGIAPLRTAIKEMGDVGAAMLSPIVIAGCGVEVDVTLPSGVSTEEIQGKRRKLAENLARHEHEVFITIPEAARTVRLWIADSGALDEPIGPSPLVTEPATTANYQTGRAPWARDLRGDAALLSVYQRHLLVTGLSNQGKTAALRALALWLALDKNVEFRIADLKGAGDWAMFFGLATVLIEGPTDAHVATATLMVEDGVREMERRLMAPVGTTWKPLILIVDEAQVAFMCPEKDAAGNPYGGTKATARYFMACRKIHNQGRAVDVLLWQGTQDPTDQNLPKLVREGAHTRASLAVGTESQAKMALGDKAVDGGAAPHLLRQGLDKGTLVVASDGIAIPKGQTSITLRTHFIDTDQAKDIADRAKALRSGVTTVAADEPAEELDPLADVAAVLGGGPEQRVATQEVLHRLAERNPAYRQWTFADLKQALEPVGAEPYKSNGISTVSRQRVLEGLAERDREQENDDSGDQGGD